MNRFLVLAAGCALLLAASAGLGRAQPIGQAAEDQPAPAQPASEAPIPLPPPEVTPPPPAPVETPAKLEHMKKAQAESLLGEAVLDAKGDRIGRIVDVLIDARGTPHAAVIEFAGFLGVGNRNVAVAWSALDFKVVKNRIVVTVDMNPAKLKAMPAYTTDAKSVPVAAPVKAKAEAVKRGAAKADAAAPGANPKGEPAPASAQ